ncbi:MAG: LytTR family transcriptional regulator [Ruminococcus sp.]|nr:LytTR family transcriptional regulator [Ruminococcus sp.]
MQPFKKENLTYAEVYDHKTIAYGDGFTIEKRQPLSQFCEEHDLLRIHKSYAVNLKAVKSVSCKGVMLKNNTLLPVRRGMIKNIRFAFKKRIFSLLLDENVVK